MPSFLTRPARFASVHTERWTHAVPVVFPGVMLALMVALAAQFIADHHGAPAMLMALLLGMPLQFLSEEGKCVKGISFASSSILRLGVALLGARMSLELIQAIGFVYLSVAIVAMLATIGFGLLCARALGHGWRLGVLTAGSVAVCGASAAIAISAVLPKNEFSERNLIFTVIGVTLLSTVAMVTYPVLAQLLNMNEVQAGVFLGGAIHDVAGVVGAGFSSSQTTGEIATVVKLTRVAMLAPVVLLTVLIVHRYHADAVADGQKPTLLPGFLLGFIALAVLGSLGWLSSDVTAFLSDLSRWSLLVAIAAVGMKTAPRRILDVGRLAIVLIVAESIFIAGLMSGLVMWFS